MGSENGPINIPMPHPLFSSLAFVLAPHLHEPFTGDQPNETKDNQWPFQESFR
jgi:hypothetical protein